MNKIILQSLKNHFDLKDKMLQDLPSQIEEIASLLIKTLQNNNKLMWCGNGGSAAQAEHLSAELLGERVLCVDALSEMELSVPSTRTQR